MDQNNIIMSNIKTLKEIILDEQRLVTYISLSKELCMHVNDAKILLAKFVEDVKCNNPKVNLVVNHIISGLLKNNEARTMVCLEGDVDVRKSEFKSIFFQHIYSVGQGLASQDTAALVAVNRFEDLALCVGLIKSNLCTKHSTEEIGTLKSKMSSNPVSDELHVLAHSQVKKEIKDTTKAVFKCAKVENLESISKTSANKSVPVIKSEVTSPNKQSSSKTEAKKNSIKKSNSIAGFFTKANGTSNTKATKSDNGGKSKIVMATNTNIKIENMDVDEDDIPAKNEVKINSKTETKNKSLNAIKKNAKVDNKRKRVLHVSDSESENEKETGDPFCDEPVQVDQDSEDEIPPTPQTNTVKITSGIVNPKKRRKVVDKTYTDEDGYILTKKEEVYESCSDNEDVSVKENVELVTQTKPKYDRSDNEVSPKDKKSKNTRKKVSPPQKGKQATLMTFFKKVPNKG